MFKLAEHLQLKNFLPRFSESEKSILLLVFALFCAGLVMVYSSSFIFALEKHKDGLFYFKKHLVFGVMGWFAFFIGFMVSLDWLKKNVLYIYAAGIVALIATLIPGLAHRAGGASRWIDIFGFSLQPSELIKFVSILFLAKQVSKKIDTQTNFRSGFLTYFIGLFPVYFFLLKQPDFGTVALLFFTTFFVLLGSGIRLKYLLVTMGTLLPTISILILSSPYRKARLLGYLDPWADPAHKGFQIIQSLTAFFLGKWTGVGLGNSHEKLFYLPEAHNDFIFAVVGEELGFVGVVFFLSTFLILVLKGLELALKTEDVFKKALILGISSMIGLQSFFNMAVVLGLLPTKGLPLPLISYGGSSLLTTLFMLGVLFQLSVTDLRRTR